MWPEMIGANEEYRIMATLQRKFPLMDMKDMELAYAVEYVLYGENPSYAPGKYLHRKHPQVRFVNLKEYRVKLRRRYHSGDMQQVYQKAWDDLEELNSPEARFLEYVLFGLNLYFLPGMELDRRRLHPNPDYYQDMMGKIRRLIRG